MRVYIGPYISRWTSYLDEKWLEWRYKDNYWNIDEDQYDRWDRLAVKLSDSVQWIYNHTINLYLDEKERKIDVRIDRHDTFSADDTLAHIILPMLKQLKKSKHGSPWVEDEDVPEELRSTSAPPKENEYDIDENHHARWDWVLDEIIWTFEMLCKDDWESDYYEYESDPTGTFGLKLVWDDREGKTEADQRIQKGLVLFGKYYRCLWD